MIAARQQLERLRLAAAARPIDEPMLSRDPPRPPAGQLLPQRLGLAGAGEGMAPAFLDQRVDPLQHLRILALPSEILGPGFRVEGNLQGWMSSCSSPSPASSRAIPSSRCFAFA